MARHPDCIRAEATLSRESVRAMLSAEARETACLVAAAAAGVIDWREKETAKANAHRAEAAGLARIALGDE